MLTRTRLGWSIDRATPARWAASAAAASDCIARTAPTGDGAVSATSCSEPPRIHSATTRPPEPVWTTSSTRAIPGLSIRLSRKVRDRMSCRTSSGRAPSGIDEGQRHLPVQRGVQRLPELQGRRAAVEDQQPVAAAGDTGAGNQVDVVGRRLSGRARGVRRTGSARRRVVGATGRRSDGRTGAAPTGSGSGGMSGWKSSATGRGGASAPDPEPDPALDALSTGRSVTSGPFAIRALATRSGGLRRIGSWTALTPGGDEFLCSGYVTGPGRDDPSAQLGLREATGRARAAGANPAPDAHPAPPAPRAPARGP